MIGYVDYIEDKSELDNMVSDNTDTNTTLVYEE